jgi:hypothetical protein
MEPFERELRRVRRPAAPPPRMDGFSEDGLSYSVANDIGKQWGQAMAEYEARTADPRFIPGARVESPDAPDVLRRELLDPLTMRFETGAATPERTPNTRLFKSGNDVISVDPITGQSEIAFKGEAKPDNRLSDYELGRIKDQQRQWNSLLSDPFKKAAMNLTDDMIKQEIQKLDQQARTIILPSVQEAPLAPDAPTPQGFIGDPLAGGSQFALPVPGSTFMGSKDGAPVNRPAKRLRYNVQSGRLE